MSRSEDMLEATAAALELRESANISDTHALCVYDLAEYIGVDVWFRPVASLEGMYVTGVKPRILLPASRPNGRKRYSCAHELGHHAYGHSDHLDFALADSAQGVTDPREFIAQCFAGFLLMPPSAVEYAFTVRGWDMASSTPEQTYTVSSWLGVGYSTLVAHMCFALRFITGETARALSRTPLKRIRSTIIGAQCEGDLVVVDEHWAGRPVDLEVGDLLYVPRGTACNGGVVVPADTLRTDSLFHEDIPMGGLYRASSPGIATLVSSSSGWSAKVRVSRSQFAGWNKYRHLEEVDDE